MEAAAVAAVPKTSWSDKVSAIRPTLKRPSRPTSHPERGLDLIKFIGELFKLQMLTERIMHECVKKMLGNVDNPEEEEIEGLCELLSTVGQLLDMPKARAHMDVYFLRMKDSIKSANVTSRVQFMVQDIIELRQRGWVSHSSSTVPTTQVVHELAIESREADAILIADLFARAISKNLCTRTAFEQGFSRVAESLEDVVIDAPEAWTLWISWLRALV
ncbi:armadillo-type protein [Salix suchowensis]|nr:armadillo-type protein [Salix suchowensis]